MHPAWQNYDVRCLIFRHLKSRDLVRLARTCKVFSDVAIDELWRTIYSFEPLLSCLPPDFRFRPLQLADIQRLDFYAYKVRNLFLEPTINGTVMHLPPPFQPKKKKYKIFHEKSWKEVWKEIAMLRPTSHFFPTLRRLCINNVIGELLIPLIGISGLNLTQIYIRFVIENGQSENHVLKLLHGIQDSPNLESLFVRDGEPNIVTSKLIKQSPLKYLRLDPRIKTWRHNTIKSYPLRREILEKPNLENLTLHLTPDWDALKINASNNSHLPALKSLCLNLTRIDPKQSGQWSPPRFFRLLDSPELSLLNIKFRLEVTGRMLVDVVSAANNNCRLRNLTELALTGDGWYEHCNQGGQRPGPMIKPTDLRAALKMLLPLQQLKVLKLSVAPNFLDVLDLNLYKSITDGIPALEKLSLGHSQFVKRRYFEGSGGIAEETYYEKIPLHNLASFCCMLPKLIEVSVGAVDSVIPGERRMKKCVCRGVKYLNIYHWAGNHESEDLQEKSHIALKTYFPNTDLAMKSFFLLKRKYRW